MSETTPPVRPTIISPDTGRARRIPPGQAETKKWPVLHYGEVPNADLATWNFTIAGEVEAPVQMTFEEFRNLPWVDVKCDIHCVTRWSRLNNTFSGPSVRTVMEKAKLKPSAKFALIVCEQGFTTNLPIAEFMDEDCLFALEHDGKPLTPDHGYPVRLVVPKLYFWKSAKWVRGVELMPADVPGFWEQNGYHMHGDPWTEERHSWE